MANEQNLKPIKSKEEARERGRAGGIASGIAKREKKIIKEAIEKKLGNSIDSMVDSMINEVINKGSVSAMTFIRDTIGEKPVEEVHFSSALENEIESYMDAD